MKLKLMPILIGAITCTGCLTAVHSLNAAPLTVNAQANLSGKQLVAQAQTQRPSQWLELNLTQTQKDQIAQIRKQVREQIQSMITPEQRDKFKAAMQSDQGIRAAIEAMNLSDTQKTQLRTLKDTVKPKIQAILTTEQRQQLQKKLQERLQQLNTNQQP